MQQYHQRPHVRPLRDPLQRWTAISGSTATPLKDRFKEFLGELLPSTSLPIAEAVQLFPHFHLQA